VTGNNEAGSLGEPAHYASPQIRGSANSKQLPAGSRK
jgi:hypothetical protein